MVIHKTTIPKWNCGNNDEREKYVPRHPCLNEYQEPDYLSGVKVDLPPKKPFKRARNPMKKRTVKRQWLKKVIGLCMRSETLYSHYIVFHFLGQHCIYHYKGGAFS